MKQPQYVLVIFLVISWKVFLSQGEPLLTLSSHHHQHDATVSHSTAEDGGEEEAKKDEHLSVHDHPPTHVRMGLKIRDIETSYRNKVANCSEKEKCMISLKERKLDSQSENGCACDRECSRYGDCCEDSKFLNLHKKENFSCHQFDIESYYVIDWCPPDEADDELVRRCEKGYDHADPLGSLPLTDTEKRITYRNLHCAQCHNDVMDKIWWSAVVACEVADPRMNAEYVHENLIQDNVTQEWFIAIERNGTRQLKPCIIGARFTDEIATAVRVCKPNLIDSCPPDSDPELVEKCEQYLAPRNHEDRVGPPAAYRNVHCAKCHNVDPNSLTCLAKKSRAMEESDGILPRGKTKSYMPIHISFPVLLDIKGSGKPGRKKACLDPNYVMDPFRKTCVPVFCSKGHKLSNYKCVTTSSEFVKSNNSNSTSSTKKSPQPLELCVKILLQEGFYQIFNNETVYSKEYNRTFGNGSFEIDGNKVYVCADFINYEVSLNKFSNNMGLVTLIGLGISIVALVCHIICFILVSEVRNLSGQNLLCLSITLIMAYSSFILMQCPEVQRVRNLCTAVGVAVFYFFLASMGWMNVIALDVWRTLRLATIELRVPNGKQKLRFFLYSLYAWSFSGLFVVGALIADYFPNLVPDNYRPGFGRSGHCWFDKRDALIVFFAAPIAIIMLINLMAFVCTATMVRKSATESKSFSNQHGISHKLYFKLMLLMGLTWIVGFIASVAESLYLWYLFIVLNTLQGLFIFIAFSCKRKVFDSVSSVITRLTNTLSGTSYSISASNLSQNQYKNDSETMTSKTSSSIKHTG